MKLESCASRDLEDDACAELPRLASSLLRLLGQEMLEIVVTGLEGRPELAARLSRAITSGVSSPRLPRYMSIDEYARHSRVSTRTIRKYIKAGMIEGEHFHREGQTGRRYTIRVEAADAWRASRRFAKNDERSLHDLGTNEILRRRAALALKKSGGR